MIWTDTTVGILELAYWTLWIGLLACSWNDWAFIAWVSLTVAPWLILD